MKIDIDDLDETYNVCLANGNFREKNVVDVEFLLLYVSLATNLTVYVPVSSGIV